MTKRKEPSDIQKIKSFSEELVLKSKGKLVAPSKIMEKIQILAPEAIETLEHLMRHSKADSVKLKAALEVLGLAGFTRDHKLTITTQVEDMDDKSLNTRLNELLAQAGSVVLEGTSKDVTPKEMH
jgi:hypothetical protein